MGVEPDRAGSPTEDQPEWAVPAGVIGLLAASAVVALGTVWAFERSAPDFTVFYTAWKLVLEGRGAEIYRESPDRYLYAPGFAWLLSPLAWLSRSQALAVWCLAKAGVVGFLVREFQRARRGGLASFGMAAWGVVLLARPLLIDFQYGQVNLLILGACAWALLTHGQRGRSGAADVASWFVLAIAAAAKIFPLPLLILPWLPRPGEAPGKRSRERWGMAAGLAVVLMFPLVSVGLKGFVPLMLGWRDALVSRGLPFESHNQSFSALLHRWFSGELVHVVALGPAPIRMGLRILDERTIRLMSLAWILVSAGALLAWLSVSRRAPYKWAAVAVALLILPSHLVWKPYFVMFLPVGILIASSELERFTTARALALAVAFLAMNVFGFDVLGPDWGARVEAASQMLWAGLVYLAVLPD